MKLNTSIVDMLQQYKSCTDRWWFNLSANPHAYLLLCENQEKINWINFSKNTHPIAIISLKMTVIKELDKEKISWAYLSENQEAIEILQLNPQKYAGFHYRKTHLQKQLVY